MDSISVGCQLVPSLLYVDPGKTGLRFTGSISLRHSSGLPGRRTFPFRFLLPATVLPLGRVAGYLDTSSPVSIPAQPGSILKLCPDVFQYPSRQRLVYCSMLLLLCFRIKGRGLWFFSRRRHLERFLLPTLVPRMPQDPLWPCRASGLFL